MKKANKTAANKMGIKENSRVVFVNADKETLDNINLPKLDIVTKLEEEFDYIHLRPLTRLKL